MYQNNNQTPGGWPPHNQWQTQSPQTDNNKMKLIAGGLAILLVIVLTVITVLLLSNSNGDGDLTADDLGVTEQVNIPALVDQAVDGAGEKLNEILSNQPVETPVVTNPNPQPQPTIDPTANAIAYTIVENAEDGVNLAGDNIEELTVRVQGPNGAIFNHLVSGLDGKSDGPIATFTICIGFHAIQSSGIANIYNNVPQYSVINTELINNAATSLIEQTGNNILVQYATAYTLNDPEPYGTNQTQIIFLSNSLVIGCLDSGHYTWSTEYYDGDQLISNEDATLLLIDPATQNRVTQKLIMQYTDLGLCYINVQDNENSIFSADTQQEDPLAEYHQREWWQKNFYQGFLAHMQDVETLKTATTANQTITAANYLLTEVQRIGNGPQSIAIVNQAAKASLAAPGEDENFPQGGPAYRYFHSLASSIQREAGLDYSFEIIFDTSSFTTDNPHACFTNAPLLMPTMTED